MKSLAVKSQPQNEREVLEPLHQYLPDFNEQVLEQRTAYDKAIGKSSAFRSPLSVFQSLRLRWEKYVSVSSAMSASPVILTNDYVPLVWRKILNYLYDTGVIRYRTVFYEQIPNDEPKIYATRLEVKELPQELSDGNRHPVSGDYGHGYSVDPHEAISKMIGEMLERYALTIYKKKDFIRASVKKMAGEEILDPLLINNFSAEQKDANPLFSLDGDDEVVWARGISLMSNTEALIPAQLIFWNYRYGATEKVLAQPTTNGAAGMFTRDSAVLAGLYELIQRDAFLVHWLNKITPPRIDLSSIEDLDFRSLVDKCLRYGLEVHAMNVTSDIPIPAVSVAIIDRSGRGPAVSVGGGCGWNVEHALMRALSEAISVRYWIRRRKDQTYALPKDYIPFISTGLRQKERLLYWGAVRQEEHVQFFIEGKTQNLRTIFPELKTFETVDEELAHVRRIFEARGKRYEIFFYSPHNKHLRKLGYASAKVIVPALLSLYLDESYAPINNPRLREACVALGHTPPFTLNPIPHPFP